MYTRLAAGLALIGPLLATPASAAPTLGFHSVQYDAPGRDTRGAQSLNAEWISLVNPGPAAVSLTGWSVRDSAGHEYVFGSVRIAGRGGRVWIHTGPGTDTGTHLYWNSKAHIWNNTGDTAQLLTSSGKAQDTCTWKSQTGRTVVGC